MVDIKSCPLWAILSDNQKADNEISQAAQVFLISFYQLVK